MKAATLSLLLAGISASAIASPTPVVDRAATSTKPPIAAAAHRNVSTRPANPLLRPSPFKTPVAPSAYNKNSFSSRKPAAEVGTGISSKLVTHRPASNNVVDLGRIANHRPAAAGNASSVASTIARRRPNQTLQPLPEQLAKSRPKVSAETGTALRNKLASTKPKKVVDLTPRPAVGRRAAIAGDDFGSALPIGALPFGDGGNTCNYNDDYTPSCGFGGSPDVVYAYAPTSDVCVDVSLCGSAYDTEVHVYQDGPANPIGCNDDFGLCGLQSRIKNLALAGGHTYYIVVDGYGGDCGGYQLTVNECPPPPPPVNCPPNARPEGEPVCQDGVDDNYNGGCNSFPEAYTDLECTTETIRVCGTYGNSRDSFGSPVRDTDWYRINVNNTTNIHYCVTGQYPTQIYVLDGNGGCSNLSLLCGSGADAGQQACCDVTLPGGTYYLFVSTQDFEGVPCGSNYSLELTRDGCPPPPPPLDCPPNARPEGEPVCQADYEDTYNGGCNSFPEAYTDLECTTELIQVCGTYGTYSTAFGDSRDTDWYRINVNNTTNIHYAVTGQFPTTIFVLDGNAGCSGISVLCSNSGGSGQTIACDVTLPGGTYYLFVATSAFSGVPCGSNYVLELSRDGCPPPPEPIPCPPNARPEGEPVCQTDYDDTYDGGCNSFPEAYVDLECTTETIRVCGTYGTFLFQGLQYRDTDWYRIHVNNTSTIHYCVTGQFPTTALVLDGNGGCAGLSVLCGNSANAGQQTCCDVTLGPGTYYLFVGTSNFSGVPCGSNYVLELTRDACPDPPGPIPCPAGAMAEGEPECGPDYVDNYDGGCNSSPEAYVDLPCSTEPIQVCGTYGTYDYFGFQYRDTDWYRINVNNTTNIHYCVTGQFSTTIFVLDASGGCSNLGFVCASSALPGQTACCDVTLGAGTYYLFVGTSTFSGVPCGSNYVLELTRDACPEPPQPIPCPPNAMQEGEPDCAPNYTDNYNGGCNSDPEAYVDLPCSTDTIRVCGTYGTYDYFGLQYRDTDWYRILVTGNTTLHYCVTGQASTDIYLLDGSGGCANLGFVGAGSAGPGGTACIDVSVGPGVYYLFVGTSTFAGVPCGSNYVLELSRDACPPPPPPLECPPNAIQEGEPVCQDEYVDNYNGGCNSDPAVYEQLPCGADVTVCGTYGNFLYQGNLYRDTDWYQITVTQTESIHYCVEGEAGTLIAILDASGGCSNFNIVCLNQGGPLTQVCCDATLSPGTYWLFVATDGFSGVPCGAKYVMHLTGHDCPNQCPYVSLFCAQNQLAVGFATYQLQYIACNPSACPDSVCVSITDQLGWIVPFNQCLMLAPGTCDTFTVTATIPGDCPVGTVDRVCFVVQNAATGAAETCCTELSCTGTTPVRISDMEAEPGHGFVDVKWSAFVDGAASFKVFRAQSRFGGFEPVSEEIARANSAAYHFVDHGLKPATEYWYKVGFVEKGQWRYSEPFRVITPSAVFAIQRIAPNPTSGFARVEFEIPRGGQVNLDIFNLQGQKVRRLVDGHKDAGNSSATWDGRSDRGEAMPAGAYFMRLVSDGRMITRRVVLVH